MSEQAIPDFVKVRALKGFRGPVDGRWAIVNPGDVVTVSKGLAIELRMAQKAVMTDEPLKTQKDYLPERKRKAGVELPRTTGRHEGQSDESGKHEQHLGRHGGAETPHEKETREAKEKEAKKH